MLVKRIFSRPGTALRPLPAPKRSITVVIFRNTHGERLSKKFSLVDGKLEKQSATYLSRGTYNTAHLPFDQGATQALDRLGELLQGLGPDRAIAIGHHKQGHESGTVASISKSREGDITRTLSNFAFSQGPGFILVDNDSGTGTVPILEALYPAFGQVACLTRPSSSSGLYDARTGAPLSAGGGEHVYFVADDQSQHKAILHAFQRLAWTKGNGRLELSRNGATLIRALSSLRRLARAPDLRGRPGTRTPDRPAPATLHRPSRRHVGYASVPGLRRPRSATGDGRQADRRSGSERRLPGAQG